MAHLLIPGQCKGHCCINSVGRSSVIARFGSGGETVGIEQLVDEPDFVFDVRLAGEAMPAPDHPHHFEPFDRSGGRFHRLKASRWSQDSLECAVVCLDDVVKVLRGAMLRIARQLVFSLQPADGLRVRAELVGGDGCGRPMAHCRQRFSQEAMRCTGVSPIHQHKIDQQAMLVDGPEQVFQRPPTFTYVSSTRQEGARYP